VALAAEELQAGGSGVSHRVTLRDLLTFVFRERGLIALTFAVPLALGLGVGMLQPTTYTAESRLLVLMSPDYVFRPVQGDAGAGLAFDRKQIIQSEVEILSAKPLAEKAIATIGLDKLYPEMTAEPEALPEGETVQSRAATRLTKDLVITPIADSNVIKVAFTHKDAEMSAHVLNMLIADYLEKRRALFTQSRAGVLLTERDAAEKRLRDLDQRVEKFRKQNQISSFDEQVASLLRQATDLRTREIDISGQVQELKARLTAIEERAAKVPPLILLSVDDTRLQSIDNAKSTLLNLELRREDLVARYLESSDFVQDIEKQIKIVRGFISTEEPRKNVTQRMGRNPVLDQLDLQASTAQTDLDGALARMGQIQKEIDRTQDELERLTDIQRDWQELLRNRDLADQIYRNQSQQVEQAKVSETIAREEGANVRIIEQAQKPFKGQSLRLLIVLMGAFLGVVASLTVAFLKAVMTDVLVTPEALERALDLPVLTAIADKGPARAPSRGFFSGLTPRRRLAGAR